jgi:hypothetical protein
LKYYGLLTSTANKSGNEEKDRDRLLQHVGLHRPESSFMTKSNR